MKPIKTFIFILFLAINISVYASNGQYLVNKTLTFDDAKNGAEKGDPYCMAVYSIYQELGWKNSKPSDLGINNLEESMKYAEESSRQSNPLGMYQLGKLLLQKIKMMKMH